MKRGAGIAGLLTLMACGGSPTRPDENPCLAGRSAFAKRVVEWSVPACSLAQNHYNDPLQVLGPPDAGGSGPDAYFGFMSLGFGGHVTVDMEACAADGAGPDLRVYQMVSQESVTVYAAVTAAGPFLLLGARIPCATRVPGNLQRRYCDFDLAVAGLPSARYLRVEDGELTPCADAGTVTEGADIDAVELLHQLP